MTFSAKQADGIITQLNQEAKQINSIRSDLEKNINEVKNYWKGDSQDKFYSQYTKFKPSLEELEKLVTSIGKQLKEISDLKEATEKKIAASFK